MRRRNNVHSATNAIYRLASTRAIVLEFRDDVKNPRYKVQPMIVIRLEKSRRNIPEQVSDRLSVNIRGRLAD